MKGRGRNTMSGSQVLRGAGRALLLLAALAVLAGATGCQRVLKFRKHDETSTAAPQPPDYLKVTGIGSPNAANVATTRSLTFTGAFQGPVNVDVVVPLDKQIADPAQRVLMGRAEARRKALRLLGQTIMNTRDAQGGLLGETLHKSPADQSKLNKLLEEKARVTFTEQGVASVHATAAIEGRQIVETLGLLAPKAAETGPSALPSGEKKELAASMALESARKSLQAALLETKLPDGRTVKEAMEADPDAAVDFNAMLWVVQPDETAYRPDGSCQVTIFFDRNRLPEIFKNRRHWWQFWKWFPHKPNLL